MNWLTPDVQAAVVALVQLVVSTLALEVARRAHAGRLAAEAEAERLRTVDKP
jgi:hypothetical protein